MQHQIRPHPPEASGNEPIGGPWDILILSNGPGELSTWVRPVVKALRSQLGPDRQQVRISVVLSPCPNASGREAEIAQSYPEVDRVQAAEHFFPFLLWGKTVESWDWRDRGVIIFLGGDQLFPVLLAKRLGYRTVVYAEWEVRWVQWIDRFAVMQSNVIEALKPVDRQKCVVVGDLMSDVEAIDRPICPTTQPMIGLLPGSKAAKLSQGVPLMCAIAEWVAAVYPQARFVLPMAPSLDLTTLAKYADPTQNPIAALVDGVGATLILPQEAGSEGIPAQTPRVTPYSKQVTPYLKTEQGVEIELWTDGDDGPYTPHHGLLRQCDLCVTTVGANTAELGALGIPMIVMLPTNQLDAMRSWDGILGLLANLPGVGTLFAKLINTMVLKRLGLLAWPNIWAKREIVPEMVGHLTPQMVADRVLTYIAHPEQLQAMREALRQVRGEPGAATKVAQIVQEEMAQSNH
ncbi:lipid-A-disaccharide synthase [Alkalinema sp. FACHB-956]|uniref:lipid-A-disaccharide synthase n=1 Tax=Alkalinema sp. FACHB-956 TaxID=2692768 RepID=UPI001F5530C5|nr:lipid-A-disaccharide synthase [Alkalinema sp. FACHB-956]